MSSIKPVWGSGANLDSRLITSLLCLCLYMTASHSQKCMFCCAHHCLQTLFWEKERARLSLWPQAALERQAKCCTSASSLRVISCQNPVNRRGNPKPKAPKFKQNTAKRRGNPKPKGPISEIIFQPLDFADSSLESAHADHAVCRYTRLIRSRFPLASTASLSVVGCKRHTPLR